MDFKSLLVVGKNSNFRFSNWEREEGNLCSNWRYTYSYLYFVDHKAHSKVFQSDPIFLHYAKTNLLFVPTIALKKFFSVLQINLKTKHCLLVVFLWIFQETLTIQRLTIQHLKVLTLGYSILLTFSPQTVQKIIEIN